MSRKLFIIILFFLCDIVCGELMFVDSNSPDVPGSGSSADPFRFIKTAIEQSEDGDRIILAEGVYTGQGNTNLGFGGKAIEICSRKPSDPEVISNTIIDANGSDRVFYFRDDEDENSIVRGLTIRNGSANYGGGIYCFNNSSPSIEQCFIISNEADYGGGVCCVASSPIFKNCVIRGNEADFGGAFSCRHSEIRVINCTIVDNSSGIYCHNIVEGELNPILINTLICGNDSFGIEEFGEFADADVSFCCFFGNGDGNWYDYDEGAIFNDEQEINSLPQAHDNVVSEPQLNSDRYHLNYGSMCIDSGNPAVGIMLDIDGKPRVIGESIDIGCHEFYLFGDLNYDGKVNFGDLDLMCFDWLGDEFYAESDLNLDYNVNFKDLSLMGQNWGK